MCTDYRYSAYFHLFLVFYIVIYRAAAAAAAAHCKATGHNISSLAVLTSLALPDLPTTLISTASMTNLRANLALARLVGFYPLYYLALLRCSGSESARRSAPSPRRSVTSSSPFWRSATGRTSRWRRIVLMFCSVVFCRCSSTGVTWQSSGCSRKQILTQVHSELTRGYG